MIDTYMRIKSYLKYDQSHRLVQDFSHVLLRENVTQDSGNTYSLWHKVKDKAYVTSETTHFCEAPDPKSEQFFTLAALS